jgi:N-acetylmuramic acid 6-phosphate etherase
MVKLGKSYGNLMVDLTATNAKLVDRSERILMETTGADRAKARAALDAAGGSVKTAIVMLRRALARPEAEKLLVEHHGKLRPIVGPPPDVTG